MPQNILLTTLIDFCLQLVNPKRPGVFSFFFHQGMPQNILLTTSIDFCLQLVNPKIILCAKKLIFLSFGDMFFFPNSCAIQTNLSTKELLKKTVLENMGYWQNGLEIEKRYVAFKYHWVV